MCKQVWQAPASTPRPISGLLCNMETVKWSFQSWREEPPDSLSTQKHTDDSEVGGKGAEKVKQSSSAKEQLHCIGGG